MKPIERCHGSKGKKGKQVNVLDEQEKPGEDPDNHIERLSNPPCALHFDMMSDDVENERIGHDRPR